MDDEINLIRVDKSFVWKHKIIKAVLVSVVGFAVGHWYDTAVYNAILEEKIALGDVD